MLQKQPSTELSNHLWFPLVFFKIILQKKATQSWPIMCGPPALAFISTTLGPQSLSMTWGVYSCPFLGTFHVGLSSPLRATRYLQIPRVFFLYFFAMDSHKLLVGLWQGFFWIILLWNIRSTCQGCRATSDWYVLFFGIVLWTTLHAKAGEPQIIGKLRAGFVPAIFWNKCQGARASRDWYALGWALSAAYFSTINAKAGEPQVTGDFWIVFSAK